MWMLVRSEWLKLSKRPMSWILLLIFEVLMVVQFFQYWLINAAAAPFLEPQQIGIIRAQLAFPGAFAAVFGHINGLGGIFAVVLAAGVFGSEYSWGTLRTFLPHAPNRTRFLLAKLITLLVALLLAMLVTLVVGLISGVGFGALSGIGNLPTLAAFAMLPLGMLRALLVLLPYVLVTVAAAVYGRSLLVGLVVGLVFQFADIAFGAVTTLARLGGIWPLIYQLTVQANINTLTNLNRVDFGLDPAALNEQFDASLLPPAWLAVAIVLLYSLSSLGAAIYWFRRHDVGGAH